MFVKGTCLQEVGRAKVFPNYESQRATRLAQQDVLRRSALRQAGCTEEEVIAFTARRINKIRGVS